MKQFRFCRLQITSLSQTEISSVCVHFSFFVFFIFLLIVNFRQRFQLFCTLTFFNFNCFVFHFYVNHYWLKRLSWSHQFNIFIFKIKDSWSSISNLRFSNSYFNVVINTISENENYRAEHRNRIFSFVQIQILFASLYCSKRIKRISKLIKKITAIACIC